jgi:site-specific DNA-methyltransferase (adenine-specific)
MAVRIEDAGFEIRDMIAWVYGSGFPKSLDVSKAIDKAAGAEREVVGRSAYANRRPNAVPGLMETGLGTNHDLTAPATEAAKQWEGWGTAIKPALEPITLARKPPTGTIAANVLEHGTGGLNIGACRVGTEGGTVKTGDQKFGWDGSHTGGSVGVKQIDAGRFPANFIHDNSEEVLALFPETKSGGLSGVAYDTNAKPGDGWGGIGNGGSGTCHADTGSAARFFYCAKASRDDRDEGCGALEEKPAGSLNMRTDSHAIKNGQETNPRNNPHPTVKPTDLMRYLCRLITPPGGIVLDPFTGSGSTGKAAMAEGFRFIGIEREAEYIEIARARISAEAEKPRQLSLF